MDQFELASLHVGMVDAFLLRKRPGTDPSEAATLACWALHVDLTQRRRGYRTELDLTD
ncbi:MAG TPA: hypothetical protein VJY34_12650 [Roseiarcus sp.]|nr:hypothetical protein [Roseiarcus sp.]